VDSARARTEETEETEETEATVVTQRRRETKTIRLGPNISVSPFLCVITVTSVCSVIEAVSFSSRLDGGG